MKSLLFVLALVTSTQSFAATTSKEANENSQKLALSASLVGYYAYKIADVCPLIVVEKSGEKLGQVIEATDILFQRPASIESFAKRLDLLGDINIFENEPGSIAVSCEQAINKFKESFSSIRELGRRLNTKQAIGTSNSK